MQGKFTDLTGSVFGRLTVIGRVPHDGRRGRDVRWLCRCICGKSHEVFGFMLKKGQIQSCGCLRSEVQKTRKRGTHGQHNTKVYHAWETIKQRCLNPQHPLYSSYGGRGIDMSQAFRDSFEAFAAEVGMPPSKEHTIDRINNNLGYIHGNLRWATRKEQMNNTRKTRLITHNGITLCVTDWAKALGIGYSTLHYRLEHWPLEKALSLK